MAGRELGFFDGVRAFFGGVGFIVGRPAMWGWAAIPAIVATVLFGAGAMLAIWAASDLAEHVVAGAGASAWATAGLWTLRIVFAAIGLVLAFLIAFSLAQPLSGFALDAIARRQELALGGRAWPELPLVSSMLRSLRVTLLALAVSLPILALLAVVTFLFPPVAVVTVPLKLIVAGFAITYDFLDYPLGLRGAGARSLGTFLRAHVAAALGFGLAASAVLMIPGVGLFLLPIGVAGATRLVIAADRA